MILSILKILWHLMLKKKKKQNKQKNRPFINGFDKFFLIMLFLPPVYILARYLRWYVRQDIEIRPIDPEDAEQENNESKTET